MAVFAVLVLAAPMLLLATAVVALVRFGPLGWLAALLLIVTVALACRLSFRLLRRWWRGTRAPTSVRVGPAERRRRPPM